MTDLAPAQDAPRSQVGDSTSSPRLSTPGEKHDPRFEPEPGDVLEAGGIRRRVVAREHDLVTFDLPTLPNEGAKGVTLATWQRWAKRAGIVDRDLKPANTPGAQRESANGAQHPAPIAETTKPEKLSARDAAALGALRQLRDGSGRVPAALGQLLDAAQLKPTTWERAVKSLVGLGLLKTWTDEETRPNGRRYEVRRYELTREGQAVTDAGTDTAESVRHRSGVGAESVRHPLGFVSKSSTEEKKEHTHQDTAPIPPESARSRSGVGEAESVPPSDLALLLARALDVIEAQAKVIAELSGGGAKAATTKDPAALPPCERCNAPTVLREGPHGPFPGCSRYPACKPGAQRGNKAPTTNAFDAVVERRTLDALRDAPPVSRENLDQERMRLGLLKPTDPAPVGQAAQDLASRVSKATTSVRKNGNA